MLINYNKKYLKYKIKYFELKNMIGGTLFKSVKEISINPINSISFNPINGDLAIGTVTDTKIYNNNYELINTLKKEKTNCSVNHVSFNGSHLVTSCGKDAIVWDNKYKEFKVCKGDSDIIKMECAPFKDKPIIPICYNNSEIITWMPTETNFIMMISNKKLELPSVENREKIGIIESISWSNQNPIFVTCSTSRVTLWRVSSSPLNITTNLESSLISPNKYDIKYKLVAFVPHKYSSNNDYMALVIKNNSYIHFYRCASDGFLDKKSNFSLDTGYDTIKKPSESSLDEKGITLVVFHPTKKYLATCGTDNNVKIWSFEGDYEPKNFINIITINAMSEVSSIAFHNTDIVIGCKNGKLMIWKEQ